MKSNYFIFRSGVYSERCRGPADARHRSEPLLARSVHAAAHTARLATLASTPTHRPSLRGFTSLPRSRTQRNTTQMSRSASAGVSVVVVVAVGVLLLQPCRAFFGSTGPQTLTDPSAGERCFCQVGGHLLPAVVLT